MLTHKEMAHKTIPTIPIPPRFEAATPTTLIIKPTPEKGITNQFNHPRKGINPSSIPKIEIIPIIKPIICI
jgi:hypothetical protein